MDAPIVEQQSGHRPVSLKRVLPHAVGQFPPGDVPRLLRAGHPGHLVLGVVESLAHELVCLARETAVLRQDDLQHFVVVELLHQFSDRPGGGVAGFNMHDFTPHPTSRSNATTQIIFCSFGVK